MFPLLIIFVHLPYVPNWYLFLYFYTILCPRGLTAWPHVALLLSLFQFQARAVHLSKCPWARSRNPHGSRWHFIGASVCVNCSQWAGGTFNLLPLVYKCACERLASVKNRFEWSVKWEKKKQKRYISAVLAPFFSAGSPCLLLLYSDPTCRVSECCCFSMLKGCNEYLILSCMAVLSRGDGIH